MRRRPGRMLLGLLLPVLAGFAVAKTGFGSKSTARALNDVSHTLHLPKVKVHSRDPESDDIVTDDTKDNDFPAIADSDSGKSNNKLPPADRKFLGIF